MLNISFTDKYILVLQTKKNLIGSESIIASSKKTIPPGLVEKGTIQQKDEFVKMLDNACQTAYPKSIRDNRMRIVISDDSVLVTRFKIHPSEKNSNFSKVIIEKAKENLNIETDKYENFYKIIDESDELIEILYTAIQRDTIYEIIKMMNNINKKVDFISTVSFAIYEIIKLIIKPNETILYTEYDNNNKLYYFFDSYGVINIQKKTADLKNQDSDIIDYINNIRSENEIKIDKIIIGGESAIETNTDEVMGKIEIPIYKLNDILEKILRTGKLNFDSGGISLNFFGASLGVLLQAKNKQSINFCTTNITKDKDVLKKSKNIGSEKIISSQDRETVNNSNTVIESRSDNMYSNDPIIEYKKSGIGEFIKNKLIVVVSIVTVAVLLIVINILKVNRVNISLPSFIGGPSITPSPTLVPSSTPTPTIDSSLKRSDLNILIENGTEKNGYAKETSDYLKDKGYNKISVSNADKNDYKMTIIRIKDKSKKYIPLLISDLDSKFNTQNVENLAEDNKYDLVVILGIQ